MVVAPPSYENPRDASDHQDAMAMDPILINYVCELFLVQGFGKNHHDNVYDWIDLQRKECMKEVIIISAEMLRIYISK